jgi:hypothetical protein
MKFTNKHIAAIASLMLASAGVVALAEDAKLPAGHPAIPAADAPKLPSGHPAIPGVAPSTQPALPAGHPALPSADPSLPPGHPGVAGANAPRPAAGTASIALRAYQGTKGAAAVGADAVVVELYHRGALLQKVDAKLDATGNAVISGLPINLPFQPLIRINHAGVEYTAAGNPMDATHTSQKVEMAVFETTEEVPDWSVQMLHVMMVPAADGMVHVEQMMAIANPADRAWLGKKEGDKRVTMTFNLPAGAAEVGIRGGDGCELLPDNKVANRTPLSPGVSQIVLEYVVPMKDNQATLNFTVPGTTQQAMVIIPDGTTVIAKGLESGGVKEMGKSKAQIFKGENLKAGAEISLCLAFDPSKAPVKKAAAVIPEENSSTPKMIAGVGGGLILAIGTAWVFLKPAAKPAAKA